MYTNDVLALQVIAEPCCLTEHKTQLTLHTFLYISSKLLVIRPTPYTFSAKWRHTADSPKFSRTSC